MMVRVEVVYLFALKKILGKIKSGWSYVRLQTSFAGIPKVWFPSTSVLWFQVTQISILSWSLFKSIFLTLGVWQPQALLFWIANGLSLSRAHLYPSRDSPASVWSIPYLLSLPGRQSPPPPVLETRPHFPSLLCSCRAGTWHSSANQMQPPRTSSLKQVIQRSRNGMYLTKLAAAARRIFRGSGASGPVAPLSFLVSPCGVLWAGVLTVVWCSLVSEPAQGVCVPSVLAKEPLTQRSEYYGNREELRPEVWTHRDLVSRDSVEWKPPRNPVSSSGKWVGRFV